ncbi:MAG: chondroitinase family polysaccharide lyase [Akkermansiaceae bacterium]
MISKGYSFIATCVMVVQPLLGAPDIYSFEANIPAGFKAGKGTAISLNTNERVHGKKSLKLAWDGSGGVIDIKHSIDAENKIVRQRKHAAVFHLWLYQGKALNGQIIRFEFGRDGQNKADCWFDYKLGFSGWRTLMMPYNRMDGQESATMDWIRIRTPEGAAGQAHIDLLLPSVQFDRRHASQDSSYQFSRDDVHSRNRKGNPIDLYHQGIRDIPDIKLNPTQTKVLSNLAWNLEKDLVGKTTKTKLLSLRKRYAAYKIKTTPTSVSGEHIFYLHTADIYKGLSIENDIKIQLKTDLDDAGKLLLDLAKALPRIPKFDPARDEVETMIVSLNRLLLKSGWHEGHGQGTMHHFGYSSREYYAAGFLTRRLLEKNGLRRQVARSLQWFNDAHYCYNPFASTHYANLDYFHTLALPQLMALLMTKAEGERHTAVLQWSKMLSGAIANDRHGSNGGFKEDGTAFHHWGHYPAYEIGALKVLPTIFRLFSDTPYRLSHDAYQNFRKALLTIRIQSNLHSWPRSLSGRHPFSQAGISGLKSAFVDFAHSGTPDGQQAIDQEIAAATLRLFPDAAAKFPGYQAEAHPSGHWAFPYAHTSAHRRDDWLAVARGLSKYVWGSEIYGSVNHYGRYQSHGTLEILSLRGLTASGVSEEGWDWSRPPGATVTRVPLDQIPYESIIMMPTTDETFVGNSHMDQQDGLFAMVLKDKPEPSRPHIGIHAYKSYSFFGDTIVCLGSSISSSSDKYPAETILFQQHLDSKDKPLHVGTKSITEFPYQHKQSGATFLRDTVGHHYRIPADQGLHIARQHQHSFYHYAVRKDAKKNHKNRDAANATTEADYAVAWLDHGVSAKNKSYHYSILVSPTPQRISQWKAQAGYKILQHDAAAHIVRSDKTTTYAIFNTRPLVAKTVVSSVSAPCLIITKGQGNTLKLNLTDPDLRLPGNEGGSIPGEIFVPARMGPDVSVITVTLNGRYTLKEGKGIIADQSEKNTTLTLLTQQGRTISCLLKKQEN